MAKAEITTFTGHKLDVLDPRPEQISIVDIGVSLSRECRFGGHTRKFYSVAQHSVCVADLVMARSKSRRLAYAALLHDAHEAYLGDMPAPIKAHLPALLEIESALDSAINEALGVEGTTYKEDAGIERADLHVRQDEALALMHHHYYAPNARPFPFGEPIRPLGEDDARRLFFSRVGRYRQVQPNDEVLFEIKQFEGRAL